MKVGVIGTGHMGQNHVQTYLAMNDVCQLVGIYDDDKQTKRDVAEYYRVQSFQSVDDLLGSVDAVSIAVPTERHYAIGLACVRRNVHMLMEKPLTNTVAEADDLIAKAHAKGVKLQTGHIELYNPFIQVLLELLESESIIGMSCHRVSPEESRLQNVNVVTDLMIHDIYIFNEWFSDSTLDFAAVGQVSGDTPKHAAVVLRTSQGETAQLTSSFMAGRKVRSIRILTKNGMIEADILHKEINVTRTFTEKTGQDPIPVSQTIQVGDAAQPLYLQLRDFLSCLKSDSEPSVTGEDGRRALAMANQITDAIVSRSTYH
ncbi:Gfo/Idh/MocA family oxidoreductase [Barrientosiimonas marina]|uniref:Gfo/Idh/MocA family protein n=1 Tax=Lentibacillus kimchii TaxID=1542911 RepID=A0ABW2UW30_9BACI